MLLRKIRLTLMWLVVVVCASAGAPPKPNGPLKKIIVRGPAGKVEKVRQALGGGVLDSADDETLIGISPNVSASNIQDAISLNGADVEEDRIIRLPKFGRRNQTVPNNPRAALQYYSSNAPQAFVNQQTAKDLDLVDARKLATGKRTIVAIIDTGVDPNHPLLKNSLLVGRNYVVQGSDTSEWNDDTLTQGQRDTVKLNQSQEFAFALDQSQEFAFALDQSQEFAFALDSMPATFGHGTMVAGLVHLVAPEAMILPMKAFSADGWTTVFDVVRRCSRSS